MRSFKPRYIPRRIREFNGWFDEFILEAAKLFSIAAFILGTVAVFNRQGLAIAPWIVTGWSIAQAAIMDGVFFAVWYRIARRDGGFGLYVIGIVLAVIAMSINAILAFQVLWGIADSQIAISRLGAFFGLDANTTTILFTITRAILAVIVVIMVAFVQARRVDSGIDRDIPSIPSIPAQSSLDQDTDTSIPAMQFKSIPSIPRIDQSIDRDIPAPIPTIPAQSNCKDEIRLAIQRYTKAGRPFTYPDIAREARCSLASVKVYAPQIKRELAV